MPNPLREGGPPCALGLRGRAPTEENPKRGRRTEGPPKPQGDGPPPKKQPKGAVGPLGFVNEVSNECCRVIFNCLGRRNSLME